MARRSNRVACSGRVQAATWAIALGAALLIGMPAAASAQGLFGLFGTPPQPEKEAEVKKPPAVKKSPTAKAPNPAGQIAKKKADPKKEASPKTPQGPLTIVISIAQQRLTLYANGGMIEQSPVSTGVPGHPTPTGVFSVIQKNRFHRSNIYSNAPMPYMQRITWSGVALHQGVVPGRPASHGCIRLPEAFAAKLWEHTKLGARVIVTEDELPPPAEIVHAALFAPKQAVVAAPAGPTEPKVRIATVAGTVDTPPALAAETDEEKLARAMSRDTPGGEVVDDAPERTLDGKVEKVGKAAPASHPKDRVQLPGAVSVLISRKEGKLYIRKGFDPIFETAVKIAEKDRPIGTHVFTAMTFAKGEPVRWTVVTVPNDLAPKKAVKEPPEPESPGKPVKKGAKPQPARIVVPQGPTAAAALDRVTIPRPALRRISALLTPGASLIISDNGLGPETGLGTDFIVLTR